MRIGFDGRYAEGDLVGVGKYIKSLVLGLDKLGVECVIFYSRKPKHLITGRKIKSVVLPKSNRITFEQIFIPKALKKYQIDIYHATGNIGIPLFSNVKSVLTIHDLIPLQYKNYFSYSKFPFLSRLLYKFCLKSSIKYSDRIVSVSKFTKKEIVKRGINPDKISVIHSGVNALPKSSVIKNIYGDYIVNNGGLDIRKNTDGLINAFALVNKKFPKLKLVITGENSRFKKELSKLVIELKLVDSVVFTGYVDDGVMTGLIKNAKCLCYPSIIEGFGFPVLEAFSLGVPVVTSNTSSIPEIAGNAAFMVKPKDVNQISEAVIKILSNKTLSNRLINSGKERAKMFVWENAVKKYFSLYNQILNEIH